TALSFREVGALSYFVNPGRRLLSHRLPWAGLFQASSLFSLSLVTSDATGGSFLQEQFPLGDAVGVAEEGRAWPCVRRAGDAEQLQAGFVREAVGLFRVHAFAGPDQVFPRVPAATAAGHDVIEAALLRAQDRAGVLAAIAVALANRAGAELGALL